MLGPRCLLYSHDPRAVRSWVTPLRGLGATVDLISDPQAICQDSDILLARLASNDDPVLDRLGSVSPSCASALFLPQPELLDAVTALRPAAVQSVIAEERVSDPLLAYVAGRLLWGNIFGIAKLLPWGILIGSETVQRHADRSRAVANLNHYARGLGIRARHRDALQLVADELLMNALYDAPVDAEGRHAFANVPPSERASAQLEHSVLLQYGCDGGRFVIGVRDTFGSLQRSSVLRRLEQCARSADPIERKTSGAGLGLYIVASHVSELIFNVAPNSATEVIAVVELRKTRQKIGHLGLYTEPPKAEREASQRRSRPSAVAARKSQAPLTARQALLTVASMLVFVVAMLLFAWPYFRTDAGESPVVAPRDARIVIAPASVERARIQVLSSPAGARIWIDEQQTNQTTPALLTELEPDREHRITLRLPGFEPVHQTVVARSSAPAVLDATLSPAPGFALLTLRSDPPAARVWIDAQDSGLETPLDDHLVAATGAAVMLKLTLPGYLDWAQEWDTAFERVFQRNEIVLVPVPAE